MLARGRSNFTGSHKTRRCGWARLSVKTIGFEKPFSELNCACETIVAASLARGESNLTGVHKTRRCGWARLSIKTMGFENPFSKLSCACETGVALRILSLRCHFYVF